MEEAPSDASGHRARLRQRLFEGGGGALLNHELVEYLLALSIPPRDTKAKAKSLIARFGGMVLYYRRTQIRFGAKASATAWSAR